MARDFYLSGRGLFTLQCSFKEVGKDFPALLREYRRELLTKEGFFGITYYLLLPFVDSGDLSCQIQQQHRVLCIVKKGLVLLLRLPDSHLQLFPFSDVFKYFKD